MRLEQISDGDETSNLTTHSLNPQQLLTLAQEPYQTVPERAFCSPSAALPLNTETNFAQWSAGLSRPPVTKWKALLSGVSLPLSDA